MPSSENKVAKQLPPLSPPRTKRQSFVNIKPEPCTKEATPSKPLIINGTKFTPISNSKVQQRPSFLSTFPRPSSACGSSPLLFTRSSTRSSPLSPSPKPFTSSSPYSIPTSPPLFGGSSTPTWHNFISTPKIQANEISTSYVSTHGAGPLKNVTKLGKLKESSETVDKAEEMEDIHERQASQGNTFENNGLTNLLTEVEEKKSTLRVIIHSFFVVPFLIAAFAVLFPERVWSIHKTLFSKVNSMSCISR